MSVLDAARAEREDLVEFLATLTPAEWESPTLCEGWRVHDVVAHLISYDELSSVDLVRRFAAGRFLFGGANAVGLTEYRERTPAELLDLIRAHLTPSGLTAWFGGGIGLTDALIHHQDIRRPLGRPRTIPPERLRGALRIALIGPPLRGALRARDVRLVASDLDWTFGRGPEVHGTAEALLMTLAGRREVVPELTGPGVDRFAGRMG